MAGVEGFVTGARSIVFVVFLKRREGSMKFRDDLCEVEQRRMVDAHRQHLRQMFAIHEDMEARAVNRNDRRIMLRVLLLEAKLQNLVAASVWNSGD